MYDKELADIISGLQKNTVDKRLKKSATGANYATSNILHRTNTLDIAPASQLIAPVNRLILESIIGKEAVDDAMMLNALKRYNIINDSCPTRHNPLATESYFNILTGRNECRVPKGNVPIMPLIDKSKVTNPTYKRHIDKLHQLLQFDETKPRTGIAIPAVDVDGFGANKLKVSNHPDPKLAKKYYVLANEFAANGALNKDGCKKLINDSNHRKYMDPLATEAYIRADTLEPDCRRPVVSGKFDCFGEQGYSKHITLATGEGICVKPNNYRYSANTFPTSITNAKAYKNAYDMYSDNSLSPEMITVVNQLLRSANHNGQEFAMSKIVNNKQLAFVYDILRNSSQKSDIDIALKALYDYTVRNKPNYFKNKYSSGLNMHSFLGGSVAK